MKYKSHFDLIVGWTPRELQDWLTESCLCDIAVRRTTWRRCKVLCVEIEASTPEEMACKRRAFNAMSRPKATDREPLKSNRE